MEFVGKLKIESSDEIPGTGFFPALSMAEFRKNMRVMTSIDSEQCQHVLIEALHFVSYQLLDYESKQISRGYQYLADVPSREIAGKHRLVNLYQSAVFNKAKALLMERYRDIDMTRKAGEDKAAATDLSIRELEAMSVMMIRQIKGKTMIEASLI